MNETPIFMKHCLFALRANKSLPWAVYKSAEEVYGDPITLDEFKSICDRPKTPKFNEYRRFKQASVWLARHFQPVFLAYCDGEDDEDITKIWVRSDRGELGRSLGFVGKRGSARSEKMFQADNYFVGVRSRDKRYDWNTVK